MSTTLEPYARPPRAAPAPLPEYRTAAHAKAVEARSSLAVVTSSIRSSPPRTPADWRELEQVARRGIAWARDAASVCRDAAEALERGEK